MSISSSSHLTPDDVARHTFGTVRRGFDPNEVRAYLESLAVSLRGVAERERQLLDELSEAEHRAAHPVLDEATLTAALGTETARVLHSAHEAAAEMVAKSEAEADRLLTEAREEIQQTRDPDRSPPGRAVGGHRGGRRRVAAADRAAGRRDPGQGQTRGRPPSSSRPASSAGPWWTRPRDSGPGCWPTCPSAGRSCTPRSSSSGPAGSGWPRRCRTSAARSTPSPRSCSPPRTTPGWPPRRPAVRRWTGPSRTRHEELATQLLADEQEAAATAASIDIPLDAEGPDAGGPPTEGEASSEEGAPRRREPARRASRRRRAGPPPEEVDALFAKLRAARLDAETSEEPETEPSPPGPTPEPEPVPESEVTTAAGRGAGRSGQGHGDDRAAEPADRPTEGCRRPERAGPGRTETTTRRTTVHPRSGAPRPSGGTS